MKITLPSAIARTLEGALATISSIITELRRLTLNGIDLRRNVQCKSISVVSAAVATTEFTVTHNLGVIPFCYIWNTDETGMVYDSRRVDWTINEIYLKCDGTSANLRIIVFG